jgi:hypothetical protein
MHKVKYFYFFISMGSKIDANGEILGLHLNIIIIIIIIINININIKNN